MRVITSSLVLAAFVSGAATAHAGDNEVSIGSSSRTLRSKSANAVTADSLGGGVLGAARALDIELFPRLGVWLEGNFGWGGAEGQMFQTLFTEVDTLTFAIGGRARYTLHRNVHASARLDVGTARAKFAIQDSSGHTAKDKGWGGVSSAALGLDLLAVAKPRFSLGLRFELGYVAASAIDLVATPETGSEGTLQLQMTAAGLGSLDLSGATVGVSVLSQF